MTQLRFAYRRPLTTRRCPRCRRSLRRVECARCELFKCSRCHKWRPWELGAADNHPTRCDNCWEPETDDSWEAKRAAEALRAAGLEPAS